MTRARYLAVVGDSHDDGFARQNLNTVFRSERLLIAASSNMPSTYLPDGLGIVLGTIFDHSAATADMSRFARNADGAELQRLIASIFRSCWGSYMVAIDHPHAPCPVFVRDPSGGLPVYYADRPSHVCVSNDVDLLQSDFRVDWNELHGHLLTEGLRTGATCLKNILEVGPGTTLHSDTRVTVSHWSPWDHCCPQTFRREDAVEQLRYSIQDATAKLTANSRRPLAYISGGLDSSIVLAALAAADRDAHALTIATRDPSGDERVFARAAAAHFGVPLHERFHDLENVELTRCAAPHLPRPKRRPIYQSMSRLGIEVAGACNADAIVSGNGGDHVFCLIQSGAPIVDCFNAKQPLLNILATVENICTLTGCSVREALGAAWRRWHRSIGYNWPLHPDLLSDHGPAPSLRHPWLDCPAAALPGKAFHVAMLLQMQEHMESPLDVMAPAMLTPLMTQPVIELCLGIPSWEWVRGGVNRSVARDAFARDLPDVIANRKVKAGPESFSVQFLAANRTQIRDLLLGGLLAEQRFIDIARVAAALDDFLLVDGEVIRRLVQLVDVEGWCRHWEGRRLE